MCTVRYAGLQICAVPFYPDQHIVSYACFSHSYTIAFA